MADVDRVVAEGFANQATHQARIAVQRLVTQAAGAALVLFERLDQSVERPRSVEPSWSAPFRPERPEGASELCRVNGSRRLGQAIKQNTLGRILGGGLRIVPISA